MGKKKAKARLKARNKKQGKARPTPITEIEKNFHEFERRMEEVFSDGWRFPSRWELPDWSRFNKLKNMTPKVDIVDRDDDILVRADIPGVRKENVEVTLTDNTITIKGKTSEEKKEEKGDYFRSETMKGSFSRTVYLPSEVDGNRARSTHKDGMLEVVVPKLDKAKRIRVMVD